MAKGVYDRSKAAKWGSKSGRKVKSRKGIKVVSTQVEMAPMVESTETEAQIRAKLTERFNALGKMTKATFDGNTKALIVSGPPGVGKSHDTMEAAVKAEKAGKTVTVVKGFVRATGLYKTLYENRFRHCIVIFDDADSIFADEASLNMLKTATDMTRTRTLNWLAETNMKDENEEKLPTKFEFEGSIIFITNYDFDWLIAKGNKNSPHLEAMISRSLYLDMGMKTRKDYLVRVKMVLEQGMLSHLGFTKEQEDAIYSFMEDNQETIRELSLRMVAKLGQLMLIDKGDWKNLARVTCLRNKGAM